MIVTTTNDVSGYKIVRHLGVCRGITVRSRNALANVQGGLQSMLGGKNEAYTKLAEASRQEAFDDMVSHAAHAVANEIVEGITEVLAYGTAVYIDPT